MSAAAPAQPLLCAWEEADENTYAKYITSDGEFTELKGPEIAYQNQLDDGVELLADPEHGLMEKKRFETTLGTYHVYFILDQGKGFVVPITDSIPDGLVPKTYIDDDGFVFVLRPKRGWLGPGLGGSWYPARKSCWLRFRTGAWQGDVGTLSFCTPTGVCMKVWGNFARGWHIQDPTAEPSSKFWGSAASSGSSWFC